jgi:hypothetical protein
MRQAVDLKDSYRNAGEKRGCSRQQTRFRGVRMNDGGLQASKNPE